MSLRIGILLAAGLVGGSAMMAHAAVIKSFSGSSGAPGTQGWTGQGGILSGATTTDLGQNVWRMTGNNCCGYWGSPLSNQQWTDAFTLGWSLSGLVRVNSGLNTTGVGYVFLDTPGAPYNRFDISFGFDGANGFAGLSMFTDYSDPALKFTFSDNDYHLIDMRYDPLTATASLWVDGIQRLSGYTGHTQFRENHGPAFGVSGNTVQGNFTNVTFSINDAPGSGTTGGSGGSTGGGTMGGGTTGGSIGGGGEVPEPSTFALAWLGAMGLWISGRAKGRRG